MRTVVTVDMGRRRAGVVAIYNRKLGGWMVQRRWPTSSGHRYDPPHAGPFRTKCEAVNVIQQMGARS